MACKCYHAERNFIGKIGVCWGTKECEACSCGGDEAKCDFYDYVRERAKSLSQKPTNADRLRAMTDEELATVFAYESCPDGKYLECDECKKGLYDGDIDKACISPKAVRQGNMFWKLPHLRINRRSNS